VRLDQIDEYLPGQHFLHLSQEFLAFSAFLGRGQLVIRETELLAEHEHRPVQQLQVYFHADGLDFPESF
jgi:hypothetical protein